MMAELNNTVRADRETAGDAMGPAAAQTEIIADFAGDTLFAENGRGLDELLKGVKQEQKPRIIQFICDFIAYLKNKLSGVKNISFELQRLESKYLAMLKTAQKNTTGKSGVKYSRAEENNNSSIKQQLRNHLTEVNSIEPVANIQYSSMNKKELRLKAVQEFKKIGYAVDRQNFGVIEISEKHINQGLDYINTDGEKAALLAVPKVLKRGVDISGHDNHKGRSYGTITIAAPVSINGKVGNVAVVVKMTGRNRYSTHRILMPDGSEFVFEENKNAELTSSDMLATKSDQGTDISSASNNSIPTSSENVKYSVSKSDGFSRYDEPITLDDIKVLRGIGRKSINDFSADEVEIAQKWAHKFYQQLGTKSPFFRRWFGDWRAYDKTPIEKVDIKKDERKEVLNRDTGWTIRRKQSILFVRKFTRLVRPRRLVT